MSDRPDVLRGRLNFGFLKYFKGYYEMKRNHIFVVNYPTENSKDVNVVANKNKTHQDKISELTIETFEEGQNFFSEKATMEVIMHPVRGVSYDDS